MFLELEYNLSERGEQITWTKEQEIEKTVWKLEKLKEETQQKKKRRQTETIKRTKGGHLKDFLEKLEEIERRYTTTELKWNLFWCLFYFALEILLVSFSPFNLRSLLKTILHQSKCEFNNITWTL